MSENKYNEPWSEIDCILNDKTFTDHVRIKDTHGWIAHVKLDARRIDRILIAAPAMLEALEVERRLSQSIQHSRTFGSNGIATAASIMNVARSAIKLAKGE